MTDWTTTNADGGSSAANDQYLEEKDLTACAQKILEMIFTSNSYE